MKSKNRIFIPKNWEPSVYKPLVEKLNAFSWKLIAEWNTEVTENAGFSPFGLAMMMLLMETGAGEKVKEEILSLILEGETTAPPEVGRQIHSLLNAYSENDESFQLNFATQAWNHDGMKFNQNFTHISEKLFSSKKTELDFSDENAAGTINKWAKQVSGDRIEDLLTFPKGNWVMSQWANWEGVWKQPFDPHQTVRGAFNLLSGKAISTKFMRTFGEFEHQDEDDHLYVKLPLGNGLFSLILLQMPNINGKFKGFSVSRPPRSMIRVEMPQWKFQHQFDFGVLLQKVGLQKAFDIDEADFSGMSEDPIWLDQMIQLSAVEVSEKGFGAIDKLGLYTGPRGRSTEYVKTLRFDKPFIFILEENMTGLIHFMGKVMGI